MCFHNRARGWVISSLNDSICQLEETDALSPMTRGVFRIIGKHPGQIEADTEISMPRGTGRVSQTPANSGALVRTTFQEEEKCLEGTL